MKTTHAKKARNGLVNLAITGLLLGGAAACAHQTETTQSAAEKGSCSGEKGSCSGEKGSCSGEKGSCSGEKGSCSGEKGSCSA